MIQFRFSLLFTLLFLFQNCEEKAPEPTRPLNEALLPADAKPARVIVSNINCWVEQGKFNVVGICTNATAEWQKISLEAVPIDAKGKPIAISKCSSVIISTYSDAVPPTGRTSFFASWPLSDFKGNPDSIKIKGTMAIQPASGPILVTTVTNGVKILGSVPGQPAIEGWHVSSSISNPLAMTASNPRLEILVYGTDNLLWLTTVLNPDDPAVQQIFHFERTGPLKPGEERPFNLQVYYQGLPLALQEKKIGRVEIMPFEARQ